MENEILRLIAEGKGGYFFTAFLLVLWGAFLIKKYVINGQLKRLEDIKAKELVLLETILASLKEHFLCEKEEREKKL